MKNSVDMLMKINPIAIFENAGVKMKIEETLKERGARYGDFKGHADITQAIKRIMRESPVWHRLTDDKAEALDMIVHKIGRILNGDPEYHDSWHDIEGYAKLVADILKGEMR